MPVGLNAGKRRSRGGLILPGAGIGGAGLMPTSAAAGVANPTTLVWEIGHGNGGTPPPGDGIEVINGGATRRVLFVSTITRQNADEDSATIFSPSGATYFSGTGRGQATEIVAFGIRSRGDYKTDLLTFADDQDYGAHYSPSDHSLSAVLLLLATGWTVGQTAGTAATTASPTTTFAAPIAAGAYVVAAVNCLSAHTINSGPANSTLLGSASNAVQRTSRIAVYGLGDMVGLTIVPSATMSSSVACAMTAIELLPP
jgi:hypothetical protein